MKVTVIHSPTDLVHYRILAEFCPEGQACQR